MLLCVVSRLVKLTSAFVAMAVAVCFVPTCGTKPDLGDAASGSFNVTGYVHVRDIGGNLGSKPLRKPGPLVLDPSGNIVICDIGNNRLIKVSKEGTFLIETGGFGFARDNFNSPSSLATSDNLNFYVLDASNSRIVRLDYSLNWISEFDLFELDLEYPVNRAASIAVNSFGDIYVSDPGNDRIIRLDRGFDVVAELTEPGGYLECNSMVFDSKDNLYAANHEASEITVFDAYDGYRGGLFKDRFGDMAGLSIARDDDVLYIGDRLSGSVTAARTDGTELLTFGSLGSGPYRFEQVSGICVDDQGWIYVSDGVAGLVSVYRPVTP
jgi:sugar lactone lactonase YvrE